MAFDPNYHQAGDNINNLDLHGWEQLADGGAHVLATLAEDRNLRDTLAGGATATRRRSPRRPRPARPSSAGKARKATLGAYLGDRLVR